MKSIPVTELRKRTAEILEQVRASGEPVVIVQRSQPAAYLMGAEEYDAQQAELRAARRSLFLREIREAEAEYTGGQATSYDDMEALLDDLRG
jgi:prevent-host-death family protein